MQVDYLIVGQGICGSMLSWFLEKEGASFVVIDNANKSAPSKVAAGIINPVTGRRYSYAWMIDEIMPFSRDCYKQIEVVLGTELIREKSIIDFFPTPQMRLAFIDRLEENDSCLHSFPDQNLFNPFFNYEFGCGEIRPAHMVNLQVFLELWRKKLEENGQLIADNLSTSEINFNEGGAKWNDIQAVKIIFCDGPAGAANEWFHLLPYAANKGEALIIESKGIPTDHIFKKGLTIAPLSEENLFWVGSSYEWEFDDEKPSQKFYDHAKAVLDSCLKQPYKIVQHLSALRPATLERRPFVGLHPSNPAIGILNGMGTKGTSLAPFFANQLVQHLIHQLPIEPLANVNRFSRILSK